MNFNIINIQIGSQGYVPQKKSRTPPPAQQSSVFLQPVQQQFGAFLQPVQPQFGVFMPPYGAQIVAVPNPFVFAPQQLAVLNIPAQQRCVKVRVSNTGETLDLQSIHITAHEQQSAMVSHKYYFNQHYKLKCSTCQCDV